eukprot:NODE_204_length_12954_cov_1.347880.p7 type:complete len:238 gc:universal NODE_204_length_12954_cov_1.347880:10786-11499(+)
METVLLGGLQINLYYSSESSSMLILMLHGRLGKHQDVEFLAKALVDFDPRYTVATFDLQNHGTRSIDQSRNEDWKAGNMTHHLDMLSCQLGTIRDCQTIIDLIPLYKPRFNKFGVCGVSLGGHVALMLTGIDSRISFCISFIGSLNQTKLMKGRKIGGVHFSTYYLDLMKQFNPFNTLRSSSVPILMLNGSQDTLVPSSTNEDHHLFNIDYFEFPFGHTVKKPMVEKCLSWIAEMNF